MSGDQLDLDEVSYRKGVADFVNRMSADFRKHSGEAVIEDILMAVAHFGVDPAEFYPDDPGQQSLIRAKAEVYRLGGTL